MTPPRRAVRGLTLVEALVVLVLVSLLGTLLIEGTGFVLDRRAAVERVLREASAAALRERWFVSTVEAMVPSRLAARRFAGDGRSFEGTTLQPLAGDPGHPTRVRWSVAGRRSDAVVYTEEGIGPWTVLAGQEAPLAFEYADSSRRWQPRWPPAGDAGGRIPLLVRLVSAGGRTVWLARFDLFPEPVPNHREEF